MMEIQRLCQIASAQLSRFVSCLSLFRQPKLQRLTESAPCSERAMKMNNLNRKLRCRGRTIESALLLAIAHQARLFPRHLPKLPTLSVRRVQTIHTKPNQIKMNVSRKHRAAKGKRYLLAVKQKQGRALPAKLAQHTNPKKLTAKKRALKRLFAQLAHGSALH